MRLDSKANLRHIAQNTEHYTGADLKGVLYSAQLRVAHRALDREKGEEGEVCREKVECGGELSEGDSGAGVRVYRLSGVTHTGGSTADAELQKRVCIYYTAVLYIDHRLRPFIWVRGQWLWLPFDSAMYEHQCTYICMCRCVTCVKTLS